MAIVLRFVDDNFSPKQYLIRMQMLSKSMVAEELARELNSVLSVKYSVPSELLLGAMHDSASINLSNNQDCIPSDCRHRMLFTYHRSCV